MKTKLISIIASAILLPVAGFTQAPPNPPNPPSPPGPPDHNGPPERHERGPKVPIIFLGVETSPVPAVVTEQLGLPKGFGLVVDYVVPNSPAAAAGVQQSDIIKLLNDQILMEPNQLRKLLQSFPDGTNVTLTILRKGQEQKLTVKLTKKEVPKRNAFGPRGFGDWDFHFDHDGEGSVDLGDLKERLEGLKEHLREQVAEQKERMKEQTAQQRDVVREAVMRAHEEGSRAREEARRAAGQLKITKNDQNGLQTTKIDVGKAQIVFSDDKGEMRIETLDGKRILTAKDSKGMLLFSGPVETKEDLDKVPAEVRERYEKLKQHDLPSVVSSNESAEDEDEDSANGDVENEDEMPQPEQVSFSHGAFPGSFYLVGTILA